MSFATLKELLDPALEGHYAVGAFNVNNLEWLQAIVQAAEEERAPLILQASENALAYMGLRNFAALARIAAEESTVPIAIHLDHGKSFQTAMRALREGFTSIMIDTSALPYDQNVEQTRKAVEAAGALGLAVEAELGKIGTTAEMEENPALYTDPQEAKDFIDRTGAYALAASVGSAHGVYKAEPRLDFDRMRRMRALLPQTPLVLHGGSGIPDEQIRQAIAIGVAKINVNTENQVAFTRKLREVLAADAKVYDPRKVLGPGRDAIVEAVREKMRLFGTSGKA
ncbi:MAG: class II fructose-1,6-bisphosphate aldolase [Firmicutes bacterium]|nr:class II fructose-1,6-bisphosphate aldolase [Bacillota bacterium]